jgi:hypothetical protein
MIEFNTEYFSNNCYFYIKDKGENISLYYSVGETLNESRKNDERKDFKKKDIKKVKSTIDKVLKNKKKYTKDDIKKMFDFEKSGEIEELVDSDGTMLSSKTPLVSQILTPHKTTDQTVAAARVTNDPVMRGYRVYYGESEEGKENLVSEIDYSDAFGYEETKNMDYEDTVKELEDMGVDNAEERAEEFGKDPKLEKKRKKGSFIRQRLEEKETLEEIQKEKMIKMVEDILTKKNKDNSEVVSKDKPISKIIIKNLNSIKKIANKEGININQLIKILKSNE